MTDPGQLTEKSPHHGFQIESKPQQPRRIHPRLAILVGVILLGVILIIFGSGSSQASSGQRISSIRHQKDSLSAQEYQFTGQGKILGGSAETWIIGGVPIFTGDQTQSDGRIHPGDMVSIVGHITKNGGWVAERISPIGEEESFFSFAGPLESISQDTWQVAGITLTVNQETRLGEGIPIGEFVLATFQVQPDDSWLALEIQALSALEKARIPTNTPTPTPTLTPTPTPFLQKPSSPDKSLSPNKPASPEKPEKPDKPEKPKKPKKPKKSSSLDNGLQSHGDLVIAFADLSKDRQNARFGSPSTEPIF